MSDEDVGEESLYTTCLSCGKTVVASESLCPYCQHDPSGQVYICGYCRKEISPDVARCPYCGNYTDDGGPRNAEPRQRLPRVFVIAGWLVVIAFTLPLLIALAQWLTRR